MPKTFLGASVHELNGEDLKKILPCKMSGSLNGSIMSDFEMKQHSIMSTLIKTDIWDQILIRNAKVLDRYTYHALT